MEQILKKIYKSRIFGLISILFFIAVCMGIGAFAAYVKHVSNPTEQAVTYFRAFMQQDYDTMYNLLDKKDGYYISKDRYKEIMQKTRESMTIDSYKINDPRKEDGQYVVTIECTDDETDSSQNMNIYLNKKMHLPKLKPDYKVDIEKMLVKNLTIKIPQGDKLTIAGIEITDKDANITTENNIQIYNFKAILNGNYKITCENEYCAKNTLANVIKKDMEVDLTKSWYTANDRYTSKITNSVTDFINKYYSAARNRSKSDKKLMAFIDDKKLQKSVSKTVEETRKQIKAWKKEGKTIGLVPTMGFLHEGHASLIKKCREQNDIVVVSDFVNPTQFGPTEDLEAYPRDFERDSKLCESLGTDLIFCPEPSEMYHDPHAFVSIDTLSETLCGKTRPIHFKGVCTVVTKLFHIVAPDRAYFGQKDAQQLAIIRKMVQDLNFDIEIVGCPIVREEDGLAKSSRNTYLSPEERKAALCLSKAVKLLLRL